MAIDSNGTAPAACPRCDGFQVWTAVGTVCPVCVVRERDALRQAALNLYRETTSLVFAYGPADDARDAMADVLLTTGPLVDPADM